MREARLNDLRKLQAEELRSLLARVERKLTKTTSPEARDKGELIRTALERAVSNQQAGYFLGVHFQVNELQALGIKFSSAFDDLFNEEIGLYGF